MDMSTSYTIKANVTGQDAIGGLNKGLGKLKTTTNNNVAAMNKLRGAASKAIGALKALAPAIGVAAMGKFNLKGSNRDYWKIDIFWNWLEKYQVTKPKHDYEEADRQQVIGVLNVSRQKDIV